MSSPNMRTSVPKAQPPLNLKGFLQKHLADRRLHPKSLVSAYFGDIVMPNDGYTWVETLFSVFENLGINERLVRTTLFRMREEGWLDATRAGRKSYYEQTDHAKRQTFLAERLVYQSDAPNWDGSWILVFMVVGKIDSAVKRKFMEELGWVGIGMVTKGVWAHPSANTELIGELIEQLDLAGKVICMRCQNIRDVALGLPIDDRELTSLCMSVSNVEDDYKKFIEDYFPLLDQNGEFSLLGSAAELLSFRITMLNEFRRIQLRDPHLPSDLLPKDWARHCAYLLCGDVYKQIFSASNSEYPRLQTKAGVVSKNLDSDDWQRQVKEPLYKQRFKETKGPTL